MVNDKEYEVELSADKQAINGTEFKTDIVEIKKGKFHILHEGKSYSAEIISVIKEEKKVIIKINQTEYIVSIKDEYDELLQKLGMDKGVAKHQADIKAPMPGLVLNVLVSEGQQVNKDEAILVLEAMKMENILKTSVAGQVKKVMVKKGDKVEKSQVLVKLM